MKLPQWITNITAAAGIAAGVSHAAPAAAIAPADPGAEELKTNPPNPYKPAETPEGREQEKFLEGAIGNYIVLGRATLEEAIKEAERIRVEEKLDLITADRAEVIAIETYKRIEEARRQEKEKEREKDKDKPNAQGPGNWLERTTQSADSPRGKTV